MLKCPQSKNKQIKLTSNETLLRYENREFLSSALVKEMIASTSGTLLS